MPSPGGWAADRGARGCEACESIIEEYLAITAYIARHAQGLRGRYEVERILNREIIDDGAASAEMHILVSSRRTSPLVFDHLLLQGTVSPLLQRPAARPAN